MVKFVFMGFKDFWGILVFGVLGCSIGGMFIDLELFWFCFLFSGIISRVFLFWFIELLREESLFG